MLLITSGDYGHLPMHFAKEKQIPILVFSIQEYNS